MASKERCDVGLVGLGVMGQNLILNMENKGYRVAIHNRTVAKVRLLHHFPRVCADPSTVCADRRVHQEEGRGQEARWWTHHRRVLPAPLHPAQGTLIFFLFLLIQ